MRGAQRVADQHGFVLHSYPYSETSLLVEAFTREHGRVPLIAKGAKRPRSAWRGVLLPFQPLTLSWSGSGDVKSLSGAEWQPGLPLREGRSLACGFYLNELLLKLIAREDPHPGLFDSYRHALDGLAAGIDQATCLRRFEVRLLSELGYGLSLTHEAGTAQPVDPASRYHYVFERGPMPYSTGGDSARYPAIRGQTLLAMAGDDFDDLAVRNEAKALIRALLNRILDRQVLHSRQLLRDLQSFEDPEP
jgi:DNA repair protein RecO (recombination protein O)